MNKCNNIESSTTSVTVSWQPGTAGAFYTYSYDSGTIGTTSQTWVTVTGLTADTTYTFNVTVHGPNATGNSVACTSTTCTLKSIVLFLYMNNVVRTESITDNMFAA